MKCSVELHIEQFINNNKGKNIHVVDYPDKEYVAVAAIDIGNSNGDAILKLSRVEINELIENNSAVYSIHELKGFNYMLLWLEKTLNKMADWSYKI